MKMLEIPNCDDHLLWDAQLSAWRFATLTAADDLGLFPVLTPFPLSAKAIARRLGIGQAATEAMLGVLTGLGFLIQRKGLFYLSETARTYLLPDSPFYWGGVFQQLRDTPITCTSLRQAILKDPRIGYQNQKVTWDAHEMDPDGVRRMTAAMHSRSLPAAVGMARRGAFLGVKRLLDVGGGSGCFCIALGQRYPEMRFTILELPGVCALVRDYAAEAGLGSRIETVARNMFWDPWPSGHDTVFFSNIFHDWDRVSCIRLARKAFDILPPGGRIYIHEILLNDTKDGPLVAVEFSMAMLYFTYGRQYTLEEMKSMLHEGGFRDVHMTPSYGYYSLVQATKPKNLQ